MALSPSLVIWKISLQITWEDLEEGKGKLNDVIIIPKNIFLRKDTLNENVK